MSLISAAADVLVLLKQEGVEGCLVGGLAVSVYCDPRFTRDVDLAIAVDNDERAELLMQSLVKRGFQIAAVVEQEAVERLAMTRLLNADGISIDLLVASSGVEAEVVKDAQRLEVIKGTVLPVARIGHLIALKLLSVAPGRETDLQDLRHLADIADADEWARSTRAVELIEERGYARGRNLSADLKALRKRGRDSAID